MAGNKYLANNAGQVQEQRSAQLSTDATAVAGQLVALNSTAQLDFSLIPAIASTQLSDTTSLGRLAATQTWSGSNTSTGTAIFNNSVTISDGVFTVTTSTTLTKTGQEVLLFSGSPYSAGTQTTNTPLQLFQPTGTTAVTTWSASGTILGFNTGSSFGGNVIDVHSGGGASVFSVSQNGIVDAFRFVASGVIGGAYYQSSVGIVTYSVTPVFGVSAGIATLTLTGNVTSSTIASGVVSQQLLVQITQDGTGGRTFVWPTNMVGGGTPSAAAGSTSSQNFIYNSVSASWQAVGPMFTTTGTTIGANPTILKGEATLAAGTVTVTATSVTSTSFVGVTNIGPSATIGYLTVAITPGTGFIITSTSNLDTSSLAWVII
jgi:hypothetical protein